jgi:CubicO group peptidase (beta-lactamase class C family)
VLNRANGYELTPDGRFINRDYDVTELFSAGAIVSTIGDLAKWDAALNSTNILSDSSKRQMWTPMRMNDGSLHQYGFAWWVSPLLGHHRIGHTGETSGFEASFERFPDDHLSVIVLSNTGESMRADDIAKEIAPLYFAKSTGGK